MPLHIYVANRDPASLLIGRVETVVSVTIVDANDNAPQWIAPAVGERSDATTYTMHVERDAPLGTNIGTVRAEDADEELEARLRALGYL